MVSRNRAIWQLDLKLLRSPVKQQIHDSRWSHGWLKRYLLPTRIQVHQRRTRPMVCRKPFPIVLLPCVWHDPLRRVKSRLHSNRCCAYQPRVHKVPTRRWRWLKRVWGRTFNSHPANSCSAWRRPKWWVRQHCDCRTHCNKHSDHRWK